MPRFQTRQISGALNAIGRLKLYSGPLVNELVQTSLQQLGRFKALELVKMLDGFERMSHSPGEEWEAEFFKTTANRIVKTSERVRERIRYCIAYCRTAVVAAA